MRVSFLFVLATFLSSSIVAQAQVYYVTSPELNLRSGPGDNAPVLLKIPQYGAVNVMDTFSSGWWLVSYGGDTGFSFFKFLSKNNTDPFLDWEKITLSTGDQPPQCENILPSYDTALNNYLKIMDMHNEFDVIVKLVNASNGICIRAAYIKAGESFFMRNIPEGNYLLKEAYGNDFRKSVKNGQCRLRFVRNAIYKRFDTTFSFYIEHTSEGSFLPYYNLELGILSGEDSSYHDLEGSEENEDDFNK